VLWRYISTVDNGSTIVVTCPDDTITFTIATENAVLKEANSLRAHVQDDNGHWYVYSGMMFNYGTAQTGMSGNDYSRQVITGNWSWYPLNSANNTNASNITTALQDTTIADPTTGSWVDDLVIPANVGVDGFAADGAVHVEPGTSAVANGSDVCEGYSNNCSETGSVGSYLESSSARTLAEQITVAEDSEIITMRTFITGSPASVKVGLYTDDGSGDPDELIGSFQLTSPSNGWSAWTALSYESGFSSLITAGNYHVAHSIPGGGVNLLSRELSGGGGINKRNADMPTSWGTTDTVYSSNLNGVQIKYQNVNYLPVTKLTFDRTRYNQPVLIHEQGLRTGTTASPTEHLVGYWKCDDNAASATVAAEVGAAATWKNVSDGSDRNTNTANDSVDGVRGTALDTQDGAGYIAMPVGSGTIHDNDFLIKGSILVTVIPELDYNEAGDNYLWYMRQDNSNRIRLDYASSSWRLVITWGGISTTLVSSASYSANSDIQKPIHVLCSWDADQDYTMISVDGIIDVVANAGSPTSSHPGQFNVGCNQNRGDTFDGVIDEIKTYDGALLPYGAYFTGNGSVDTDLAHDDVTAFIKGDESNSESLKIGTGTITVTNATQGTDVAGNANSAFLFDASGEYVEFPCVDGTNIDNSQGNISFWFISDGSPTTFNGFFDHTSSSYSALCLNKGTSDNYEFQLHINSEFLYPSISTDIYDGNWHFIEFMFRDTDNYLALRIDGTIEWSTTEEAWTAPALSSGNILIGNIGNYSGNHASGRICNFTITNNPNTPQIPTIMGKPVHVPLIEVE
jgi:hypothetical protein